RNDIPISDGILQHVVSAYGTLRNTLRYQLGNLHDFCWETGQVDQDHMLPLDRWALEQMRQLICDVEDAYEKCEFHRIYRAVLNFCTVTLSATYHDILKDRLYTYGAKSLERRSGQTAMYSIFLALVVILLPIIPFTSDEAYAHLQTNANFAQYAAHLLPWPDSKQFEGNSEVSMHMDRLFAIRSIVYKQLELVRQQKIIGKSLEAMVMLHIGQSHKDRELLQCYGHDLAEIFIVSQVHCDVVDGDGLTVEVKKAAGRRCDRCWRWVEDGTVVEQHHLCARCAAIVMNA
ncbi:MAG: class I tRNA ligase family protein, partial [Puniceicoccales bacterium]|nr:class I tRNA ligase family protein [Puniceicoccales bacterium]